MLEILKALAALLRDPDAQAFGRNLVALLPQAREIIADVKPLIDALKADAAPTSGSS